MKKTRILALLLTLCMTVVCIPSIAASAAENGSDFSWSLKDGVLTVSGTVMPDFSYESPSPWKSSAESIHTVVIEDGMTNIGECAFYSCYELSNVTIPDSVTVIGAWSFYDCGKLTEVAIPNNTTSIGVRAFSLCPIKDIVLPEGLISIGQEAFFNNDSWRTSITIPKSVTKIGALAFCDTYDLDDTERAIRFLGDRPAFECDATMPVFKDTITIYYPANNETWTDNTSEGFVPNEIVGGKQPWIAYDVPTPSDPTEPVPTEPAPTETTPTEPAPTESTIPSTEPQTTAPTESDNPSTGSNALLPIALLLVASAACAVLCLKKHANI